MPAPSPPGSSALLVSRLLQLALIGLLGMIALVLGISLVERLMLPRAGFDPHAQPRAVLARGDLAEDERSTIELFEASAPSVVHIATRTAARGRWAFETDPLQVIEGAGSGIVWDERGAIVTNHHVVRDAAVCFVTLAGGETRRATVVGAAPDQDLAVLRIEAPSRVLRPIPLGTSSDLRVGQKVFAIGNPFGLDRTLTAGLISGLDRVISARRGPRISGVIQTDAAINPGNSGGPLLDSAGRLIGINTAIASDTGTYSGIGFAVPVDTVNRVVPQILRSGHVARPGLGVLLAPDALGRALGHGGALIQGVVEGLPAERAGFVPYSQGPEGEVIVGDRIVALDGEPVRGSEDLRRRLAERLVGDEVLLEVLRGDARRQVRLRLGALE